MLQLRLKPNPGTGGTAPITHRITAVTRHQEDIVPGNDFDPTASRTVRVRGTDLAIVAKTVSAAQPVQGTQVTYVLTVTNRGPLPNNPSPPTDAVFLNNSGQFSADTVVISDVLPVGVGFVAASAGAVFDSATRTVTWTPPGSLPVGSSVQVSVTVVVTAAEGSRGHECAAGSRRPLWGLRSRAHERPGFEQQQPARGRERDVHGQQPADAVSASPPHGNAGRLPLCHRLHRPARCRPTVTDADLGDVLFLPCHVCDQRHPQSMRPVPSIPVSRCSPRAVRSPGRRRSTPTARCRPSRWSPGMGSKTRDPPITVSVVVTPVNDAPINTVPRQRRSPSSARR